jgi:hypothetical protein
MFTPWLDQYAEAIQGPLLDPRSKLSLNKGRLELGRLLFELTKLGVLGKDIPDRFDGVPFGIFGTSVSGPDQLDLGGLLRAWKEGGLRDTCPQCQSPSSVLVFLIGGSTFSGIATWSGVCQLCGRMHSYPNDLNADCHWCKQKHASATYTEDMRPKIEKDGTWVGRTPLSYWVMELNRWGKQQGRSLWSKSSPINSRFIRLAK